MLTTRNYGLPQFTPDDDFNIADFNEAYKNIDLAINDLQETFNVNGTQSDLMTNEVIQGRCGMSSLKDKNNDTDRKINNIVFDLSSYGVTSSISETDCKADLIQLVANMCRDKKGTLYMPNHLDIYVNKPLDLTMIDIDFRGVIRTKTTEKLILMEIGSKNPRSSNTQNVYINQVITTKPTSYTVSEQDITVRLTGSKNPRVEIGWVNCFEIYSDGSDPLRHSTSYGNLNIRCCDYLRIFGENTIEPIPPEAIANGSEGFGWVTECTFHKARVRKRLFIGGNYNHNNIVFNHLTLEGALLEIEHGNRNIFRNVRTEGSASIIFGEKTWHNVFYDLFQSNVTRRQPMMSVVDNGIENIITTDIINSVDEETIIDLIPNVTITNEYCDYKISNPKSLNVTNTITTTGTWLPIIEVSINTKNIKRFKVDSDFSGWRYWIKCFDSNNNVLIDEKTQPSQEAKYVKSEAFNQSSSWWNSATNEYRNTTNLGGYEFLFTKDVARVEFKVVVGNANFSFNKLALSLFSNKLDKSNISSIATTYKRTISKCNLIDNTLLLNGYTNFDNLPTAQYRGLNYTFLNNNTIQVSGFINKSSIANGDKVYTLPSNLKPHYRLINSMLVYTSDKGILSGCYEIDNSGNINMLGIYTNVTRIVLTPTSYKLATDIY